MSDNTREHGLALEISQLERKGGCKTNARHSSPPATTWRIRAFQPDDAAELTVIYRAAITWLTSADYSVEARAAWIARCPSSAAISATYSDGRQTFIAVGSQNQPLGFSDLEPNGHIQFLYIAPQVARQGVGSSLLAAIETSARQQGYARIWSEGSQTALPLFQRAGFVALRRNDFDIEGVPIHNYAVEKGLA